MDFTEDFEVSSPCLIVRSSQLETTQSLCRSDSDLLKNLNISRTLELSASAKLASKVSLNECDGDPLAFVGSDSINIKGRRTRVKEYSAVKASGGSGNGNDKNRSEHGGKSTDGRVQGHAQTCPNLGPGGGGGGGDGDDHNDGNNDDNTHEPSTCDDDTSHSEPASSSADSLPGLITPHTAHTHVQAGQDSVSTCSPSGTEHIQGQSISQASTAIVEDVAPSCAQSLTKKSSSSSSSSGGYRSDLTNSSAYHASISSNSSSLSSESSHALSLPVGNSTSVGSRDGTSIMTPQKHVGFRPLEPVEEIVDNNQDHSTSDSSKDEQECSSQVDLFGLNKEDSNGISSQEVSRLSTPQDRSTPVEQKLSQEKALGLSLYKQVLSIQTSTPVESHPDFQQTPPSQNITPNQPFHGFHFSGEERNVKDSSTESCSSNVLKRSPESGLLVVPSSPTSPTRFEQSPSKSGMVKPSPESAVICVKESSGSTNEQIMASPSSFSFPWRRDSFQKSPEEEIVQKNHCSKESKHNSDNDEKEFIGLPRWQQELIQKSKKEQPVSSSSSLSTSSSSCSSYTYMYMQQPEQHSWQSEVISTVEGSKSLLLSEKHGNCSSAQVKHVTFLKDCSDSASERTKTRTSVEINRSLSPSSIDGLAISANKATCDLAVPGTTCTQPELSEDPFRPSSFSTQEDRGIQEEQEEPDSQAESENFDLHFTQSQSEMDSPPLIPEPLSLPASIATGSTIVSYDQVVLPLSCLLKKQDSGSKSANPEPPITSTPTTPCSTASTVLISDNVVLPLSCSLLKKDDSYTPSQSILEPVVKKTQEGQGYHSLQQHDISGTGLIEDDVSYISVSDANPKALSSEAEKTENAPHTSYDDFNPVNRAARNVILPQLSSEASSDSGTGMGFHFSLPTSSEPLRPVTCTTPPPMRSRQPVIPTTVCDTPGIFTQGLKTITTSSSATQHITPSLTLSMPRETANDTSEIFFHMQGPQSTSSSSSTTDPLESSRTMESSVFARVRDEDHSSRRREIHKDDEYNPFEFTSRDDISNNPPISRRKSRKREYEHRKVPSIPGSARESHTQVTKNRRTDPGPEPNVDEGIRVLENLEERHSDSRSTSTIYEKDSSKIYNKVTEIKTIKTITTNIKKVITITTKKKNSNEIIDKVSYVDDDKTNTEKTEDVKMEEIDFFQRDDSTYEVVLRPQTPPPAVRSIRKSPRRRKRRMESNEELNNGNSKRQRTTFNSDTTSNVFSRADGRTEEKSHKEDMPKDDDGSTSPPLLRRESTEKIVEQNASTTTTEPVFNLSPGTRVFGHWCDNHFYSGVLTSGPSKLGLYNVRFDDGNKRKLRVERMICREYLKVGQSVLAQDEDGYYDPGVVVGHYRSGDETGYEIKDEKGNYKRYPNKNVILTKEQAAAILSSSSSLSRTTSGSSVNAGGLNTRSRSSKSTDGSMSKSSSSNVSTGGLNSRSRDTSAKDSSYSSNELTRHRDSFSKSPAKTTEYTDETPKSSRKKLSRKLRKKIKQPQSWRGTRSIENSSEASSDERHRTGIRARRGLSLPTRTSPRKQMIIDDQNDESNVLGSLPSDDSLFAGFAFLITGCHSVKDTASKDDSPDSESELVEFNRQHLVQQIEAGGGVVLKDFEETQTSGADQCFLVSSSHHRTKKFFQCLAYSIPIVHHSWIHDSSTLNQLIDYKKYMLPAGTSLETNEVMEIQPRPKVLQGLKIYLHGELAFKNTWSSVVLAAGCSVVTKLANRPSRAAQMDDLENRCDVIITGDIKLPASIIHTVEVLGIPVVALEWLLQCLINGFLVPFDGHPKYDYKNIEQDDNSNL